MKELRIQYQGEPWRILFAFDPDRAAILLVGGNKVGDARWYKINITVAETRYEKHLKSLGPRKPEGDAPPEGSGEKKDRRTRRRKK